LAPKPVFDLVFRGAANSFIVRFAHIERKNELFSRLRVLVPSKADPLRFVLWELMDADQVLVVAFD